MPACLLCRKNEATKTNSHLIPGFLRKRLFPIQGHKRMLQYDKAKDQLGYVQDLPKMDNIFCPDCERRFSIVEQHASTHLFNAFHTFGSQTKFRTVDVTMPDGRKMYQYRESIYLKAEIFNLFLISLLWRASLAMNGYFSNLSLTDNQCEMMRLDLDVNLKHSLAEYEQNIPSDQQQNDYYTYVIFSKPTRGNSSGINISIGSAGNDYMLNLGDFKVLLTFGDDNLVIKMLSPNKKSYKTIRISMFSDNAWENFQRALFKKMGIDRTRIAKFK